MERRGSGGKATNDEHQHRAGDPQGKIKTENSARPRERSIVSSPSGKCGGSVLKKSSGGKVNARLSKLKEPVARKTTVGKKTSQHQ